MQVMQPHRQIVVKTFSERRFGFWFCNSWGMCGFRSVGRWADWR
jgi:hypothetical protein